MKLFVEDFAAAATRCVNPECDAMHRIEIRPLGCHPEAGVRAVMVIEDGVLLLFCAECPPEEASLVGVVAVANRPVVFASPGHVIDTVDIDVDDLTNAN